LLIVDIIRYVLCDQHSWWHHFVASSTRLYFWMCILQIMLYLFLIRHCANSILFILVIRLHFNYISLTALSNYKTRMHSNAKPNGCSPLY